ncbi:HigA family addiction module antitoxin [Dyella japonica]|uniref:HigA family addiction module antitoxin n=1 Tax=Dyella japonica TaxID=231455 RepID=UPI00062D3694|nr:HigA family addiction module antitoxin [Dyella japonica]
MELINLTPRLGVDASSRLRSPGDVLLHDYMRTEGLNPSQLARRIGIPASQIKEIVAGERSVTARHAIRLAIALDTSALYWLVLQARYDLAREARGITTAGRSTAGAEAPPDFR